jgi:hypothetical protein
MVGLKQFPKVGLASLVGVLHAAGIRFVNFSEDNQIQSKHFAEKLGLETVRKGREGRKEGLKEGNEELFSLTFYSLLRIGTVVCL